MDIEDSIVDLAESKDLVENFDVDSENVQVGKKTIPTQLPLSRIKKICKLDPKIQLLTSDAVKIISFCAERFIECFAKEMALITKEDGRKTVQMKDFERAIRRNPLFEFLEDALTDWPEKENDSGEKTIDENSEEVVIDEEIVNDEIEGVVDDEMDDNEGNELVEEPVENLLEHENSAEFLIDQGNFRDSN